MLVRSLERQWLPDTVPPSARDIRIRGDTELEILAGEFLLEDKDFGPLVSRLEPYPGDPIGADRHLASFLQAKVDEGLNAGVYYEKNVMWVLVCNRAQLYCSFQKRAERQ